MKMYKIKQEVATVMIFWISRHKKLEKSYLSPVTISSIPLQVQLTASGWETPMSAQNKASA